MPPALAPQAAPPASCPAPLVPVPDTYGTDTLRLAIDPGYGIKPVDSTLALTALSVVNDNLALPSPLALPPVITGWYQGAPGGESPVGTQGFMGEAFVDIERNGKVKRVGLTQTTLVPELDAALVAAVKKAADDGAFMAYQDAAHDHGGYVFVEMRTVPLPEFKEKPADYKRPDPDLGMPIPYSNEPKIKKRGTIVMLPIRVLHIPIVRLTSPLEVTKRGPAPTFPLGELEGRQDGFVNVEFVVGTDGAVVAGTLRLANAMTAGYAKAVINSLDRYRFKPATAGNCPVAARETYTFTFDVL